MKPEDIPQAAVDAVTYLRYVAAKSPAQLIAAALPHLIDDAMVERARDALYGDHEVEALKAREAAHVERLLRAALGVSTDV